MSALYPKADIRVTHRHVCFGPKGDGLRSSHCLVARQRAAYVMSKRRMLTLEARSRQWRDPMTLPRDTRNSLVGTWQLVSVKFELTDTGESMDMYGSEPLGYFILTAEGRLMVIETARDRQPPQNDVDNASLFKSMLAYSGHCRVLDDNRFVTDVDVAWHPAWMNTEQTRAFEIDDDLLSVSTVGMVHPNFPGRTGQAVVRWRRTSE